MEGRKIHKKLGGLKLDKETILMIKVYLSSFIGKLLSLLVILAPQLFITTKILLVVFLIYIYVYWGIRAISRFEKDQEQ